MKRVSPAESIRGAPKDAPLFLSHGSEASQGVAAAQPERFARGSSALWGEHIAAEIADEQDDHARDKREWRQTEQRGGEVWLGDQSRRGAARHEGQRRVDLRLGEI